MPERLLRFSWWRHHANSLVVVIGVILILAGTIAGILKVYSLADQAHHAVCALRQERINGIKSTKKFIHDHPEGIPGISRTDLERSIQQQQQTVRAFRFADCP